MFENLNSKLSNLYKQNHYAHNDQFDVIRNGDCDYSHEVIRKCYVFTLVLFIGTVAYGIVGLECESRPHCHIDWDALPSSPYIMFHQIYPQVLWPQARTMFLSAILFVIGCMVGFLATPPILESCLIYHPKKYEKETTNIYVCKTEVDKMCAFRGRFLKFVHWLESIAFLEGLIFTYTGLLTKSLYNVNLTSFLFWTVLYPFHIYYMLHYYLLVPFYVILASKCVALQQKTLVNRLKEINSKLSILRHCPNLKCKPALHRRLWCEYLAVNRQLCAVCSSLREYSRFWSPYLTTLFASLISLECYLIYVGLLLKQIPLGFSLMLLSFAACLVAVQFVLVHQCAAVVTGFKRITGQNRTFYMDRSGNGVGSILARNLVKKIFKTVDCCTVMHFVCLATIESPTNRFTLEVTKMIN